jgi:iron complex outermembrane receptor protein
LDQHLQRHAERHRAALRSTVAITRPLSLVPATTLVNVGAVFRTDDDRWEFAVECSNCSEEYYATSSLFGIGYYNDPRRVTARLRFNY